jgi:hypothetical protein
MSEKEDRLTGPPTDGQSMDCEQFQEQLPQLMESGLHGHPHLQTCQRCAALIEELEYIAGFAREMLPLYEPPDKVWDNIRIQIGREDGLGKPSSQHLPPQGRR